MNTHLFTGLACIGGALWLQHIQTVDIQAKTTQPQPTVQTQAYSAASTLSGVPVVGTPAQIKLAQQADWLVEQFDQEIYGVDTPLPSQIRMIDGFYKYNGAKLNGQVNMLTKEMKLESARTLREVAGTNFHERLHLAGHEHDFIYPMQEKFIQLLAQEGY